MTTQSKGKYQVATMKDSVIQVHMSSPMKAAMDRMARQQGMNTTEWSRRALASAAQYDLSKDPKGTNPNKRYNSPQERYEAGLARQRAERATVKAIKAKVAKKDKEGAILALEAWLSKQK